MKLPSTEGSVGGASKRGGGRWLRRLVKALVVTGCGMILLLSAVTCTSSPKLAPGVVRQAERVKLRGEQVKVDFYFQPQAAPLPLVVVAHGFTRNRFFMAGWGADLAARGMVVAVLTQPYLAKHQRNAQAIADLAELGREGGWPVAARGNGKVALVGYSMGGLTTLLAATTIAKPIDAWVGLDPVDFEGRGAVAAAQVQAPGLALLAEPSPLNRMGNAHAMLKPYGGELQVLKVLGASHLDAEYPVDCLALLAYGRVKPERQAHFRRLTSDFLSAVLLGRGDATARVEKGVKRVALRK